MKILFSEIFFYSYKAEICYMSTYIIYKPFNMLSQFTKEAETHLTLADLEFEFEKDVYPVGRLDADSEGLLILSNEKGLNKKLLDPAEKKAKTYWVQVEGMICQEDLLPLKNGIPISIKGQSYKTLPAECRVLDFANIDLPERFPPIRYRKNIPDSWAEIKIIEGKNRQVRKMFAAIGFPVLRLVRVGIDKYFYGDKKIGKMNAGEVIKLF